MSLCCSVRIYQQTQLTFVSLDVESKRGFRNVTTASHYLEMLKAEKLKEVECTPDGLHFNRVHRG